MMRAYELLKETIVRKTFIWVTHLCCFILYGVFWLLFLPSEVEVGEFLFLWGGLFLPLALSAGVFGDDIATGRICVLATRPLRLGELYLWRLAGLSLQGAVHLLVAAGIVLLLDTLMGRGSPNRLGPWVFASWLLFNACAALSTSLSVVVRGSYNALLVLAMVVFVHFLLGTLGGYYLEYGMAEAVKSLIKHMGLPFELLQGLAHGDYGKYSLNVGQYGLVKSVACTVHCVILTAAYATIGILVLNRRQFSAQRD
jgi:ABC-type transport system involved in multi-copper enzyme maturation permease subunit